MTRGEPGIGRWSIVVKDAVVNEFNGTFTDWRITLWGESIDASTQELHPMPEEDDDNDHEAISAIVSTTSVSPGAIETGLSANPTDHIDRPVKPTIDAKPTSVILLPTEGIPPYVTPTISATPTPSATPADTFLPHYFPTFGVSKRTQIWIYGALAIIVLFCAGLGIYFYVQRRKRLRNSRDNYEFDVLDDDDPDGANGARAGIKGPATKGRRAKKRGGELYDAFAGESDEDLLSEEDGGYKDADDDDDGREEERGRSQSRDFDEKNMLRR